MAEEARPGQNREDGLSSCDSKKPITTMSGCEGQDQGHDYWVAIEEALKVEQAGK